MLFVITGLIIINNIPFAGKISTVGNGYDEFEKPLQHHDGGILVNKPEREILPPPPPRRNNGDVREKQPLPIARTVEDDIFVGDGIDYDIPNKDMSQSPISEDMEESPRNKERQSYFNEPVYGPVPPETAQVWGQTVSFFHNRYYLSSTVGK